MPSRGAREGVGRVLHHRVELLAAARGDVERA
jgi:hypothetical protein